MQKIYKYKQNKRESRGTRGTIRERTKNRFTIQSIENNIAKLKSHSTSVTWYEYASVDEIEEVTHIKTDYGNLP